MEYYDEKDRFMYRLEERRKATVVRLIMCPQKALQLCDYLIKCNHEIAEYRYNAPAAQSIIIVANADDQKLRETLDFYLNSECYMKGKTHEG